MSFYGKLTEVDAPRKMRTFNCFTSAGKCTVQAHDIFFYESGHIGFWNDITPDERVLVLAIKALEVEEVPS